MDLDKNTVVDSLISSILTSTKASLEVDDKSLFSYILQEEQDLKDDIRCSWPVWKVRHNVPFPFAEALLSFLWGCFMKVIFCIYESVEWLAGRISGKKVNLRQSIRLNSVIFISSIIVFLTMTVGMIVFFLKDILLFPADNTINHYGAITISQPCGIEHNVFLMNACELWAETGIRVVKGDKVKISASGTFNSDILDMTAAASKNMELRYEGNHFHFMEDADSARAKPVSKWLVYNANDALFGSLLYQIKSEEAAPVLMNSDDPGEAEISQIISKSKSKPVSFKAKKSGELCFAVNDIYIRDGEMFDEIMSDKPELFPSGFQKKWKTALAAEGDASWRCDSLKRLYVDVNPRVWYSDNVGEILLNVTIERKATQGLFVWPSKLFRWMFHNSGWIIVFLTLTALLIIDFICGNVIRRKINEKVDDCDAVGADQR